MFRLGMRTTAAAGVVLAAGTAAGAPPVFSLTSVMRSGVFVNPIGPLTYSTSGSGTGNGPGVTQAAVNNTGGWMLGVHAIGEDGYVSQATGNTAYLAQNEPGFLLTPANAVAGELYSVSLNNAGNAGFGLALTAANPGSAYFNTSARPVAQGALVNAPGLAAGTVWGAADSQMRVQLNDANQMLVVSDVVEGGVPRRAVVVLQLSGAGAVMGATLIAKEGGPVGAGPDVWATIALGGHAAAINNSGRVAFSGTTTGGVEGVYASGVGFVAVRGGPTPVAGQNWGRLAGAPVDINNAGVVALRGVLADGVSTFTEGVPEAGEAMDLATRTFGNGVLTRIDGVLSDDRDVDMYRIIVDDPAAFVATTVPDAGSGFAGAAFDTVLTVVTSPENGTRGLVQSDNASPSVVQSTIAGPAGLIAGREYYICISTPKSRCNARTRSYATNTFPDADIWSPDPAGVAVAGGLVYWPDPSRGEIGRSTPAGGVQAPLTATAVTRNIAVDSAGGKVYWIDRGLPGESDKVRRANLDGSNVEALSTNGSLIDDLAAYGASGLTLDVAGGKVYWSRSSLGEIIRCNLDGTGAELVIRDYPPTDALFPPVGGGLPVGNFAPTSLAVDHAGGKVYFVNTFLNRIQRANLNGSGRASLAVGAGAAQLALDAAGGKVYWTNTAGNKVQSANLDGTGLADVVLTPSPVGIAVDSAAGLVYWTSTVDRVVRRATLAGAGAATVVTVPPETGQQVPDGAGEGDTFFEWLRTGVAATGPLPYQIKVAGARFRHEYTMITKGSQKVVAVGDVVPGTAPYAVTIVGGDESPIRISDRGDVLWTGEFYQPTTYNNYLFDTLFWNGERLMMSMDIPAGTNLASQQIVNFSRAAYGLDMSDNGEYAMVVTNMHLPPYNFSVPQPDNGLLLHFTLPAQCAGDFNQSGSITVQDIFDFLAAYFTNASSADVNHSGGVTVQDIFDYLGAYFEGCV